MGRKLFISALFLCLIFLFGCANKQDINTSNETIEIELCYYKPENEDGLKQVVAQFFEKYPNLTVKLVKTPAQGDSILQERADVGDLPDIIQLQSYARIKEYASRGLVLDLSDCSVMQKVLPTAFDSVTWNGRIYAVPTDYAGIGIIYDKDIFSKYNIEPPRTWSELKDVCAKLKANGIYPFAGLLKDIWSMGHFTSLIHTDLLVDKGIDLNDYITQMNAGKSSYSAVNTRRFFEIMDFYRDNMNPEAIDSDGDGQQNAFASKKCAMMVQGLWSYYEAKQRNPSLNAGFIPFPYSEDESKNIFFADVDSACVVSSQSSEEKTKICLEFINWLGSAEGEKAWLEKYKLIAPFKGVDVASFGGPYVELMKSVEAKGSNPWLFSQYPTEVFDDACKNSTQQYMLKKKTADEVIKDIDTQWEKATSK